MQPQITIDTSQFQRAMREFQAASGHLASEVVNQSLYDVLVGAAEWLIMKPRHTDVRKFSIREYMWFQILSRVRFITNKRSKFFGTYRQVSRTTRPGRKGAVRNLARVHLIAQARQRALGKPGLYGPEMRKAAGRLAGSAQGSVGYLVVPIKDALYRLNSIISRQTYKFPTQIRLIFKSFVQFWKGTNAKGSASAALRNLGKPTAKATLRWNLRFTPGVALGYVQDALQYSSDVKAAKLERQAQRAFQQLADKHKAA